MKVLVWKTGWMEDVISLAQGVRVGASSSSLGFQRSFLVDLFSWAIAWRCFGA